MSFGLNPLEFQNIMSGIVASAAKRREEILLEVMDYIKWLANNKEPRTPHEFGNLRGEGAIPGTVAITMADPFTAYLWFKMAYAAWVHEAENLNYSEAETGVGRKWLETKLIRYKNEIMEYMAKLHKEGLADVT